jgi:hypothetical protein
MRYLIRNWNSRWPVVSLAQPTTKTMLTSKIRFLDLVPYHLFIWRDQSQGIIPWRVQVPSFLRHILKSLQFGQIQHYGQRHQASQTLARDIRAKLTSQIHETTVASSTKDIHKDMRTHYVHRTPMGLYHTDRKFQHTGKVPEIISITLLPTSHNLPTQILVILQ